MDNATRIELNRLWTNQAAAEMVLAHLVARELDRPAVRALHERLVAIAEARHADDPALAANMVRALDRLFDLLDGAAYGKAAPPPP